MSNGLARPSGLLQPTRIAPPAPGAGESLPPVPAQGMPAGMDMQALMQLLPLLMMMMQQQGGGQPMPPQMGQPAPAPMPPMMGGGMGGP